MDAISVSAGRIAEICDAALSSDHARVKRLSSELAQVCLDQGQIEAAKRLRSFARRKGIPLQASGAQHMLPVDGGSRLPLIDEEPWPSTPVILNNRVAAVASRFLDDVKNAQRLFDGGLLTRFGLMLSGPPGTGKTLLAGHIAAQLGRPFHIARLDSLISSKLGETAKNIRQVFDYAPARGAVLLLDEIDAIAKMRDDRQEIGELKRVVNTVIQGLDSLDDRAVVIAATNHPQLLDPAIWRRFPYRCEIDLPDSNTRKEMWMHFLYQDDKNKIQHSSLLSQVSDGLSGADIENLSLATRRLSLLNDVPLPEPQLLWVLSQREPNQVRFPELGKLTADQHRYLVRSISSTGNLNKKFLADRLGISRPMVYKYLNEVADE